MNGLSALTIAPVFYFPLSTLSIDLSGIGTVPGGLFPLPS